MSALGALQVLATVGQTPLMESIHGVVDYDAIVANVETARLRLGRGSTGDWWLTLCITGTESALREVVSALVERGAENLEGTESGFLNAKIRVLSETEQIIAQVRALETLVQANGAALVSVDADSSPLVERSIFAQLWAG